MAANETTNLSLTTLEVFFLGCIGLVGAALILALIWYWIATIIDGRVKIEQENWK